MIVALSISTSSSSRAKLDPYADGRRARPVTLRCAPQWAVSACSSAVRSGAVLTRLGLLIVVPARRDTNHAQEPTEHPVRIEVLLSNGASRGRVPRVVFIQCLNALQNLLTVGEGEEAQPCGEEPAKARFL